jgi:hypothetical protein
LLSKLLLILLVIKVQVLLTDILLTVYTGSSNINTQSSEAIMHEANKELQLEQYTNSGKNKLKCLSNYSTHRYDHNNAKITEIRFKMVKVG